jgi:superfamily II DNA or RNA helicase
MRLFPYQDRLNAEILAAIESGDRRIVDRLATGLGKTTKARDLIRHFVEIYYKVLFVVDLDFVVDDTAAGLVADGIECGIIQAGKPSSAASVQVCSFQTLIRRQLFPFLGEEKLLIILDECHIFAGPEYLAWLNAYPSAIHIGLTATPQRGDGTALGNFYEKMIDGPQMAWGMTHGVCSVCWKEQPVGMCCEAVSSYLVPSIRTHAPPKKQEKLAWDPIEAWFQFAPGLPTLYFCASAKHAAELTERFIAAGVGSETITSDTAAKKRRGFRERVLGWETLVVCTHSVGIKALDLPAIACIGIWRSVNVAGVFLQMVGRAARRFPGKSEAVVIDGVGNVWDLDRPEAERVYSLDGEPIRVTRQGVGSLTTCKACGAIQERTEACVRCGGELCVQEIEVSKNNKFVEVKEVPLDGMQRRQLDRFIETAMRYIVPAAQRKQAEKGQRGEKTGRPIGPWLAIEWAVGEFKKKNGVVPLESVVTAIRTELYRKEQAKQARDMRGELFRG